MIRGAAGRAESAADPRSFAREALAPFCELLNDIDAIADGDVYHPIAAAGPPEVVALALAANRMRVSLLNGVGRRYPTSRSVDEALQSLCRLGASLHSMARQYPGLADAVQPLIDRTDDAIRFLRSAAFEAGNRRSP